MQLIKIWWLRLQNGVAKWMTVTWVSYCDKKLCHLAFTMMTVTTICNTCVLKLLTLLFRIKALLNFMTRCNWLEYGEGDFRTLSRNDGHLRVVLWQKEKMLPCVFYCDYDRLVTLVAPMLSIIKAYWNMFLILTYISWEI